MFKRLLLKQWNSSEKETGKRYKAENPTPENQPIGPITSENFSEWFDKAINYVNQSIIPNSTKESKHQINLASVQSQSIRSIKALKDLCINHKVFSEPDALIFAIRYIDDLSKKLTINNNNHLIIWYICLCLANKYHEDIPYNNKSWHQITGIPPKQFNDIELEIVKLLNFQLGMSPDKLEEIKTQIENASCTENNNFGSQKLK